MISCGLSFYAEKLFSVMGRCRIVMNSSSNRGLCSSSRGLWSSSGDLEHTLLLPQHSPLINMPLRQTMFKNWTEMTSLSIQLSLLLLLVRG